MFLISRLKQVGLLILLGLISAGVLAIPNHCPSSTDFIKRTDGSWKLNSSYSDKYWLIEWVSEPFAKWPNPGTVHLKVHIVPYGRSVQCAYYSDDSNGKDFIAFNVVSYWGIRTVDKYHHAKYYTPAGFSKDKTIENTLSYTCDTFANTADHCSWSN